jgi:hypothetical protein
MLSPVFSRVRTTLADGTELPVGSTTVPEIVPNP